MAPEHIANKYFLTSILVQLSTLGEHEARRRVLESTRRAVSYGAIMETPRDATTTNQRANKPKGETN